MEMEICDSNTSEETSEGSNDEEIETDDTGLEVTNQDTEVPEIPTADNARNENSDVNDLEENILDVQHRNISQRDYFFGTVQKMFGLCLPKIYAIYLTLLFNFLLSLANACSDISVFCYLMSQQHHNVAYVILGKNKLKRLDCRADFLTTKIDVNSFFIRTML